MNARRTPPRTARRVLFLGPVLLVAAGCEAPQCTTDRLGELDLHGSQATEAAGELHGATAARELGMALGLVRHPPPAPLAFYPLLPMGTTYGLPRSQAR